MSLRDLHLKSSYDSDEDDILQQFYVPVLSNSIKYKRLAGFFSSTALAVAARGMYNFIMNGGSMELLVSAHLSKQDVEAIRLGLQSADDAVSESALRDLGNFSVEFIEHHVKALAWMVATGKLLIKVAIVYGTDGLPLDETQIDQSGIFHQKVGLLFDKEGNAISFSGSINETAYAWSHNIEEFKVFKRWEQTNETWFNDDLRKFEKYWNGGARNARIVDIPTAVREKLISMAPNSIEHLRLEVPKGSITPAQEFRLRPYQLSAVASWKESNFHGIYSMATGTGKTLIALSAIKEYLSQNVLVVIAVPTVALSSQWKKEVLKMFPDQVVLECNSNRANWQDDFESVVEFVRTSTTESKRAFAITTYQTAGSEEFSNKLAVLPSERLCLIADEVHHVGAPFFSNVLKINFRYRMGLSATPERLWDEEGQQRIMDFFDQIIFEYGLTQALKDQVLSEYEYHVIPVALTSEELDEYAKATSALSAKLAQATKSHPSLRGVSFPRLLQELSRIDEGEFSLIQTLMFRRVSILKKARNKATAIRKIVGKGRLGRCLIYCNDMDHVTETLQSLSELNIACLRYDSSLTDVQRSANLHSFEDSPDGYLVAIKCLDEGVDIPSCDSAILVASSKSTREFIQRRGRLLRLHLGKAIASIYDILVLPVEPDDPSRYITRLEYSIIGSELERARMFAEGARNSSEINLELSRLEVKLSSKVYEKAEGSP
ncbi:MAG TPA: DEAD/DEAH box helicase family protein [Nitrososphaerales archaeon]|nr:DEAD/DEAH box helicase family protein [Nitrososphaerales archaeon]